MARNYCLPFFLMDIRYEGIYISRSALNRLVKAASKVEVDPDAAEKLLVSRADFFHALDNDVKPAFGASAEMLQSYLARGIQVWGTPVQDVIDDGALLIQQVH